MSACGSCSGPIPPGGSFSPSCGVAVRDVSSSMTRTSAGGAPVGNLSAWYSSSTVVLLLVAGALAGFGPYTSIRGRATAPQGVHW